MKSMYKMLFIYVEGLDDKRLFDEKIVPIFKKRYEWVTVRPYAAMCPKKRYNFIKGVKEMNADYFYTGDMDTATCITLKKQDIINTVSNVDADRIIIVIKEIEGWYLAGLTDENSKKLKISPLKNTDTITKEDFNGLIPKKFNNSRIDFMVELLKYFCISTAVSKNKSFRYFVEKHKLLDK